MTDANQETNVNKDTIAKFSVFRVFMMAFVMGVSSLVIWMALPEQKHHNEEIKSVPITSSNSSSEIEKPATKRDLRVSTITSEDETPGQSKIANKQPLAKSIESELKLFHNSTFPKILWHKYRRHAFVGSAVANLRAKPGGKLIGQLVNGEKLVMLDFDKASRFVKVATSFGAEGYVSIDLLSYERVKTAFDTPYERSISFDSFGLNTFNVQPSEEFLAEYQQFQALLKGLATKKSFDFKVSNIKYMIVSSTALIFPGQLGSALHLIRTVSQKPSVFFERPKIENLGPLDQELEIRASIPVRRVLDNESSKSTRFEKLIVSRGCPRRRIAAVTEDGTTSQLELLVFDIKKRVKVSLHSKPHRGNPNFTWAHADLNGDSWPDMAFYFGGETAQSPYTYLFIAHNIDGRWQMHWIEDRFGLADICGAQI